MMNDFLCSVAVPFKQDHIGLRGSERWARLATKHGDQRIVWANNVQKLNKSDIKVMHNHYSAWFDILMVLPLSLPSSFPPFISLSLPLSLSSVREYLWLLQRHCFFLTQKAFLSNIMSH